MTRVWMMKMISMNSNMVFEFKESYINGIKVKYGDDQTKYPSVDPEVWEKCVGGRKKGRLYGTGSLDLHYLVTGQSSNRCGMSSKLSQHEVNELKSHSCG